MPIPPVIPVKISSEAAGYVSITPVVVQQMPAVDLLDHILRITGKDAARIRGILQQGSVVSGASRMRWPAFEATLEEIGSLLATFADPMPARPFDASRCVKAALSGGRSAIELSREAASRKGWLARRSFWEALMEAAAVLPLTYEQYSYADRADVYRAALTLETSAQLRDQAKLLRYSSLERQVREYSYDRIDLWVER